MRQSTLLLTTNASDSVVGLPLYAYTGQLHYMIEGVRSSARMTKDSQIVPHPL